MKKSIYLILHNIRSLYNIGSMFRSADAFGVEKIYLTGYSGYPVSRQMERIAKTVLGSEKTVAWEYCRQTTPLVRKLQEKDIFVIAVENNVGKRKFYSL